MISYKSEKQLYLMMNAATVPRVVPQEPSLSRSFTDYHHLSSSPYVIYGRYFSVFPVWEIVFLPLYIRPKRVLSRTLLLSVITPSMLPILGCLIVTKSLFLFPILSVLLHVMLFIHSKSPVPLHYNTLLRWSYWTKRINARSMPFLFHSRT